MGSKKILNVVDLKKYFPIRAGFFKSAKSAVKAVDGVNFNIECNKAFGLVGESGCGKSTLGRTILRLHEATAGKVEFRGQDIFSTTKSEMRRLRPQMQLVFQDPYSSLDPRMTIGEIVGEGVREHGIVQNSAVEAHVSEICERCGIPRRLLSRYPHEFSGGQRQRICIARALALKPSFIVADEPVSALDVSIQAQIINLLFDLKERDGLSFLFISHDLSVVKHFCDDIAVMYLGKIVETGARESIFSTPLHPYTQALFSAIPNIGGGRTRTRTMLTGELPSNENPPSGCAFHTRCGRCAEICRNVAPKFTDCGGGHLVRCHFAKRGL